MRADRTSSWSRDRPCRRRRSLPRPACRRARRRKRPPVAGPAARRHRGRRGDRARGGLRAHRAPEALYDLRHGGRPGQDLEPQRAFHRRRDDGAQPGRVGQHAPLPHTPVTLGALAGRQVGARYAPKRLLPAHAEHEALGAHWREAGGWMRPACYPRKGEAAAQAVQREAANVRAGVGIFDASPLGKIDDRPGRGEVPRPLLRQQRGQTGVSVVSATA